METLKSIIAWSISPVILCLLLQLPGWLLWGIRRRKIGIGLVFAGTLVLLAGSLPVVSYGANQAREGEHPPLLDPGRPDPSVPVLAVVLGTGFNPDPGLPPNSRVSNTFLARLTEGVRVVRGRPDARLLVSVAGAGADPADKREFIAAMADLLALDPERIDLITDAQSTADEARLAAERRREGEQVVVVTSAGHMPRAMKLFTEVGLSPVAAPCDFVYPSAAGPSDQTWHRWMPDGNATGATHQLLYEFLAGFAR